MASSHDSLVQSRPRELWADNLRVLVVAGVIVVHTATGYLTGIADWPYTERTTSALWSTLLSFPAVAGGMFGLGPQFLLAGWFAPRSLAHRGPGGFARSRLLHLGVPLLAFVLLISPLADYLGSHGRGQARISFAYALWATDFGVMWFVAALLVFSLIYAALRWLRPAPQPRRPVRLVVLLAAALTIAVASLAVWQVWPWNSNVFFTARLGEWPQGAVLFALGVHAAETGWLPHPPAGAHRGHGGLRVGGAGTRDQVRAGGHSGWPPATLPGTHSPGCQASPGCSDGTRRAALTRWLGSRRRICLSTVPSPGPDRARGQAAADGEGDSAGGGHAVHPPSRVADAGPLAE